MSRLKIQSFNVNGFRAISKKNVCGDLSFKEWILREQPDIIGFQETKVWASQLSENEVYMEGYHPLILSEPSRKGYSGVGVYVRSSLDLEVYPEFFGNSLDEEGRVNHIRIPDLDLLNVYFPNGASRKDRLDYKMDFYTQFLERCQNLLSEGRNLIVMGDVNTAHRCIDLTHPKENEKTSGFLPIERAWIDEFLRIGFVDSFRHFYPDAENSYTWWDLKTRARERNVGWRIDYILLDSKLISHLDSAGICSDIYGSDHCPIQVELSF